MATWLPIPLLLVTVTALILVDERTSAGAPRNVRWVGVWKPLSTLLVILVAALALTHSGAYDPLYTALVLTGLILSLAGDVLLIFSSPRAFMAGLAAFLCAHLAYIAAFVHLRLANTLGQPQASLVAEVIAAAAIALVTGGIYFYLKPKLGKMRAPVILYMLVISLMVHRAMAVAFAYPGRAVFGALIVVGALLFYLSDAILAIDRFRMDGRMPRGHLWNLSSYYAGQLLIALSVSMML